MPLTSIGYDRAEAAHDILREGEPRPLDPLFNPRAVALIGATENPGSVGRTVLENLKAGKFPGALYPVNPKRESVLGLRAWPAIAAVPTRPDVAIVVTPSRTVPGVIHDCVEAGIPSAIIISAGFKEIGEEGIKLESQIFAEARRGKMRVIGPNCLGVMNPHAKFNATFAADMARPGGVGFISQSGALCTAILDWSLKENVGFSAFVSVGSMLDVSWGDLIYHLGDDPQTRCIVMYMETIGNARAFLSAAREVALTKPIIVIKPGRTEAAAKAAASHTGSLAGSDEVLQAAFQRVGVLRVETISELFDMAEVLGKQPRPRGPHLAIVTNAGGPGVIATDALITSGGKLAGLQSETMEKLNKVLPPMWSHNNPVDVIGDASAELYAKVVDVVARDSETDGLLVILTPQGMSDSTGTAEKLKPFAHQDGKPILASWMGADQVAKGEEILNQAGIPTFKYPDRAARAFQYMWRYSQNLKTLYETPALRVNHSELTKAQAEAEGLIQNARKSGRTILTEFESKKLLAAYGIPTVETHIAKSEEEAVQIAGKIGFPVVLKLFSETITHKTDVGGVQLNLRDASAVQKAWKRISEAVKTKSGPGHFLGVTVQPMVSLKGCEIIMGSSIDPQFGPVLLFGAGGQYVEVFKDRALGLPPLNATLARRMMEQTKIYKVLKGVRGQASVNMDQLEELLVRFSRLVTEKKWISEIDINPLLASPEGLLALDARVVLHGSQVSEDQVLPPAIRPYPAQYIRPATLKNGERVMIRPIRPEDEPQVARFHETLSEKSVHQRYFNPLAFEKRVAHERLTRICFNDYDREIALVAENKDKYSGQDEIVAVGRLSRIHGRNEAEFVMVVSDRFQRQGLGEELLRRLVQVGREEKLERVFGRFLAGNQAMQNLCKKIGFQIKCHAANHEHLAEHLLQ